MFAELIFVVLAIIVILLVDNLSTLFGVIVCALLVYCFVYKFSHILSKRIVVLIISRIWATLLWCLRVGNTIFRLFQTLFCAENRLPSTSDATVQFCGDKPCFHNEINVLVLKISQYYIKSWYNNLSADKEFVSFLNCSINETLTRLCISISKTDKKKFSYLILQTYLNFFSHFIEAKKKSEKCNKGNFKLKHWSMRDNLSEWCYLQSLVSSLLDAFCPAEHDRSLHSKQSPLLHTLVVEILTENIMHPLVNLLSDPTRLNMLFMKILLNFSSQEQSELFNKSSLEKNSILSKVSFANSPIILLPSEELDDQVFEECPKLISTNRLSVPDESFLIKQDVPEADIEESEGQNIPHDFPPYLSCGMRSSSNINLSESAFSDLQSQKCHKSISIHDTTIKRSRSADFIRQMPKLKALNEKDYNIIQQGENKRVFVALKTDINSSNCIEQAEEAVEVEIPTLFTNVKIVETFLENEAGLVPFTSYCIQYTGVFHDTSKSATTPYFVNQNINIKRRFREFVNLQSRLEANPSLKIYLKGIKGPSKWLLPFSNLDKKNIAERRIFLENYLNELCSSVPISHSAELQEFLGYGGNEKVSYIRKSNDASVPRIDKMLVRGVRGAFDIIKTALPNSPLEEESSPKLIFEEPLSDHRFQEHLLDYSSREPEIKEHVMNFIKTSSFKINCGFPKSPPFMKSSSLRNPYFTPLESCKCSVLYEKQYYEEENPFGDTVMELFAVACKIDEKNLGDFLSTLKVLCSPCINRFCVNKIDKISDQHLVILLHMLHRLLWPEERNTGEAATNVEKSSPDAIMQCIEELLSKQSILQNLGFAIKPVLLEKIRLFLSSIQHQDINKCLLFQLFDAVIESVCSEEMLL